MASSFIKAALAVALAATWLLQPVDADVIKSTMSDQVCYTSFGPTSVKPVPRSTTAQTVHVQVTTTTATITTTVTFSSKPTETSTSTKYTSTTTFTASTSTDLSTTTVRTTTTTTNVQESVTTSYSTTVTEVVTSTPTVTVPTTDGFTALGDSPQITAAPGPTKLKKRLNKDRNLEERAAPPPASYPTSVVCSKTVTYLTITRTAKTISRTVTVSATSGTITKVIKTSTGTATTTTPVTSSTVTVRSSITESTDSSTTRTITSAATTTTTTTAASATQTIYAVCEDPDNYLTEVRTLPIDKISPFYDLTTVPGTDAHLCCVMCAQTDCLASGFFNGYCYLVEASDGTCDTTDYIGQFYTTSESYDTGGRFNLSNSNCGQWRYMGQNP